MVNIRWNQGGNRLKMGEKRSLAGFLASCFKAIQSPSDAKKKNFVLYIKGNCHSESGEESVLGNAKKITGYIHVNLSGYAVIFQARMTRINTAVLRNHGTKTVKSVSSVPKKNNSKLCRKEYISGTDDAELHGSCAMNTLRETVLIRVIRA